MSENNQVEKYQRVKVKKSLSENAMPAALAEETDAGTSKSPMVDSEAAKLAKKTADVALVLKFVAARNPFILSDTVSKNTL